MGRLGSSHTEITESTEILGFKFQDSSFRSHRKHRKHRNILNTNLANETNYDAGGKGFTVHGIYGSRLMVQGSKFKGKG